MAPLKVNKPAVDRTSLSSLGLNWGPFPKCGLISIHQTFHLTQCFPACRATLAYPPTPRHLNDQRMHMRKERLRIRHPVFGTQDQARRLRQRACSRRNLVSSRRFMLNKDRLDAWKLQSFRMKKASLK